MSKPVSNKWSVVGRADLTMGRAQRLNVVGNKISVIPVGSSISVVANNDGEMEELHEFTGLTGEVTRELLELQLRFTRNGSIVTVAVPEEVKLTQVQNQACCNYFWNRVSGLSVSDRPERYLSWLALEFGVVESEIDQFLQKYSGNEYSMFKDLSESRVSFTDLIKIVNSSEISTRAVRSYLNVILPFSAIPEGFMTPAFFKELRMKHLLPSMMNERAEDIAKEFDLNYHVALLLATKGYEDIAAILENTRKIVEKNSLLFGEVILAAMAPDVAVAIQALQEDRLLIRPKEYQRATFLEGSSMGLIQYSSRLFSSALAGKVRFNDCEDDRITIYEHQPVIELARLAMRVLGENERSDLFFHCGVFELLKNAYYNSNNRRAYLDWKIDPQSKTIIVRVINRTDSTYHPSDGSKNRFLGWEHSEVQSHLSTRRETVHSDVEGGLDRGVAIARYFSSSLEYVDIQTPDGDYFGTGAVATLEIK